jgi:colanic acid biosynthesis protein WcaH
MNKFLDYEVFKTVVNNAPLVSVDLCLVYNGQILMGKRNNEPLKDQWFTPGGRIQKNERWQDALRRIALTELGFCIEDTGAFELMGVWDHFYQNSYFDQTISTHYVNLPHFTRLELKPELLMDEQHRKLGWFNLSSVATGEEFNIHMRNYARYLIEKGEKHGSS